MSAVRLRNALLLGFVVPLGACHSILGLNFSGHSRAAPTAGAAATAPDGRTMEGRALLADGQPGAAIGAFSQALSSGEAPAPALNGLGVAYARIGRLDLARRFFEEANAIDPGDARFRANLALLVQTEDGQRSRALASRAQNILAVSQPVLPGRLQRISRGAVTIATLAPRPGPARITVAVAQPAHSTALPIQLRSKAGEPTPEPARKRNAAIAVSSVSRTSRPNLQYNSAGGVMRVVTISFGTPASSPDRGKLQRSFRPLVRLELARLNSTGAHGVTAAPCPKPGSSARGNLPASCRVRTEGPAIEL